MPVFKSAFSAMLLLNSYAGMSTQTYIAALKVKILVPLSKPNKSIIAAIIFARFVHFLMMIPILRKLQICQKEQDSSNFHINETIVSKSLFESSHVY